MDKVKILRDLEYLNGGVTAFKSISKDKNENLYMMLEEWQDIICILIDEVNEDA